MKTNDYTYELPRGLIAQEPCRRRQDSRLLVLRRDGSMQHRHFDGLIDYLNDGDLLILNDTKVIPVRLTATDEGGRVRDIIIVREIEGHAYQILSKGRYTGRIQIADDFYADVSSGSMAVFYGSDGVLSGSALSDRLLQIGQMPLPPYIERPPSDQVRPGAEKNCKERIRLAEMDKERYQTVYARHPGSIAAPTAGLHFTEGILDAIRDRGVCIKTITLDVGIGTFRPIKTDDLLAHKMDEEHFEIDTHLRELILQVKGRGNRVIVVGTTTTRAVEAYMAGWYRLTQCANGRLKAATDIFITPGFDFKAADALLTNLHMPRSTTLVLACTFAGRQHILNAYREAVAREYRFLSYGDAMLII
ncbi:MAG: tRNA preQ1(34) S-adenosylmethionine ribosyltransferase-isomerase QueA [Nitrospirae bacterium]|nr:tRNA preQ1(34) S-adenosylmethionine ribosyltransferase-isomerase QueA [Nitrospirota bacterium]